VTDRAGNTTNFAYDGASQRLTSITDANGNVAVTMTYDAEGRVETQKDARGLITGQATTLSYVMNPDDTQTTTVTYPTTSFEPTWNPLQIDTYDVNGWVVEHVMKPTSNPAEGVVNQYTYDGNGFRDSVTDGRGNLWRFCYDVDFSGNPLGSRGNVTRRITPPPTVGANPLVTLYQYDAKNNLVQVIPPKGVANDDAVDCFTDLTGVIDLTYATDLAYDAVTETFLESVTRQYTDPDLGPRRR